MENAVKSKFKKVKPMIITMGTYAADKLQSIPRGFRSSLCREILEENLDSKVSDFLDKIDAGDVPHPRSTVGMKQFDKSV
jgi:hypothetical protein